MPAKVEAGVIQVNTLGVQKISAAETLVGLARTHRYSRVLYINPVISLVLR